MTRSPETAPFPENPRNPDEGGDWSDFLSESSQDPQGPADAPAPLQSSAPVDSPQTISLDELMARQVPVQWSEAVAIVEVLCRALVEETSQAGVPEAGDVSITSDGRVVVARGARRGGDLSRLSVILQTLLPASSTPLALRLFVTSSMSAERYASIARYAEALAHYAASGADQAELIRDLCRRSRAFPAGSVPVVPIGTRAVRLSPNVPVVRRRARAWVAAAVAVLVFGAVSVAVMWPAKVVVTPEAAPASVSAPVPVPVPVPASSAAPQVEPPTPVETFLPARRPAPIEPVVRDRPAREVAVAPVPPPQPPLEAPKPAPDAPALQALPLSPSAVAVVRAPAAGDQLAPRAPRETSSAPAPATVVPPAPVATSGMAQEPRIYSIEDRDVEPPVLLSPGPPILPGLADHPSNTLDLVIDERGRVYSARLVSSGRLIDTVVVSPAKNMRFQPALRNGTAVRYRLFMKLPSAPQR